MTESADLAVDIIREFSLGPADRRAVEVER